MNYAQLRAKIEGNSWQERLYSDKHDFQRERYLRLLDSHKLYFNNEEGLCVISSPGRCEIVGNHTDHNNGLVLAAAVQLDIVAVLAKRQDKRVVLRSEGFPKIECDIADLSINPRQKGTSSALIRGVASAMTDIGIELSGFEATVHSNVISGSGVSSSAAFELLICTAFDKLYNSSSLDAITKAKISQYAENVYFMKPSGLMDQLTASVGGLVLMDFDGDEPKVKPLDFSFFDKGYRLVLINTGGSHGDLTDDYAAIRSEMQKTAKLICGKNVLRAGDLAALIKNAPRVRKEISERAFLRSLHFYNENERVIKAFNALNENRLDDFFTCVRASGQSSWMLLQNLWSKPDKQALCYSLALADSVLGESGASRVHGGGFAGTTLHFVKNELLDSFVKTMQESFGDKACIVVDVRSCGPVSVF